MYCKDKVVYTIQSGDSLYKLAKQYMTTVTELILGNPGVNPYNLQVGMKLTICPGPGYMVPENEKDDLKNTLDRAWLEHVYWTRMYLLGLEEPERMNQSAMSGPFSFQQVQKQMTNEEATGERMMRNVGELVEAFEGYLSKADMDELRNLLTEHVEIAGEMMHLLQEKEMDRYQREVNAWYENAAKIAELLGKDMSTAAKAELRRLLFEHLDLTRQEIEQYFDGEYQKSIETFDIAAEQIEKLADFLATQFV